MTIDCVAGWLSKRPRVDEAPPVVPKGEPETPPPIADWTPRPVLMVDRKLSLIGDWMLEFPIPVPGEPAKPILAPAGL